MSKVTNVLLPVLTVLLPVVASAQAYGGNINNLLGSVTTIVNNLVGLLMTLAVIAFFWGLVKYIWNAGDEDKRKDGRHMMIWGVVALFVMVSIWGLVNFIGDTFSIDQDSAEVGPDDLNPNR